MSRLEDLSVKAMLCQAGNPRKGEVAKKRINWADEYETSQQE